MKPLIAALVFWALGASGSAFAQTVWFNCQFTSAEIGDLVLRVSVDEQAGLAGAQWANCGSLGCPTDSGTDSGTVQVSGDHLLVDFGDDYNLTFPRSGGTAGFMAWVVDDAIEGYCSRA